MTWRDTAIAIIGEVHNLLPPDADIQARKRALREACPHEFRGTSHGRKVWGKAATQYLVKHGMKPRRSDKLPLSPLEKLMQKASPEPQAMTDSDKRPFNVRCGACEHIWTLAYVPIPLGEMAEAMKRAACPSCGNKEKIFVAPSAPTETERQNA